MVIASGLLLLLLAGSLIYCVLVIISAYRYRRVQAASMRQPATHQYPEAALRAG